MWRRTAALAVLAVTAAWGQRDLEEVRSRLAEEAEVLAQNAVKSITRETLEQRAVLPPSRFRPRDADASAAAQKLRMQVREIVSEYSIGALNQSVSSPLVEFRQTISVDGRPIQSAESARHALSLGLHSADDRIRKRMLEDFARHGLVDLATDYGLILLAFGKRSGKVQFRKGPVSFIGTDEVEAIEWRQTSAEAGVLEFQGKMVTRRALEGIVWVRTADGLPVRVRAWTEHEDAGGTTRDDATVDYVLAVHGFLTPASVVHRHSVNGAVVTENLYRYDPFKLFTADAEIKFTDLPDSLPPAPPKK